MKLLKKFNRIIENTFRDVLNPQSSILNSSSAFTILEFLVSLGIFVVVISIAVNAFIVSLRSQHAAAAMVAVNDNLSLVIEQMSREMRTGKWFCGISGGAPTPSPVVVATRCNDLFSSETDAIAFVTGGDRLIRYRLHAGVLERSESDAAYRPLTATNVNVLRFGIVLRGNVENDGEPPRITLTIRATSNEPGIQQFNIYSDVESTVSSRCGTTGDPTPLPRCPGDI